MNSDPASAAFRGILPELGMGPRGQRRPKAGSPPQIGTPCWPRRAQALRPSATTWYNLPLATSPRARAGQHTDITDDHVSAEAEATFLLSGSWDAPDPRWAWLPPAGPLSQPLESVMCGTSPAAHCLSTFFRIFPVEVFGSSVNTTALGALKRARRLRT